MTPAPGTSRLMTADEFYEYVNRPECAHRRFELIRGEVVELPRATHREEEVRDAVVRLLGEYTQRRGKGYVAAADTGLLLARNPDTVRGPDVAVYDDAHTWTESQPKYGQVPPWLAVEILSNLDKVNPVIRKVVELLKAGTGLIWLVDPDHHFVTVFKKDREPVIVEETGVLSGEGVARHLSIRATDLFESGG